MTHALCDQSNCPKHFATPNQWFSLGVWLKIDTEGPADAGSYGFCSVACLKKFVAVLGAQPVYSDPLG